MMKLPEYLNNLEMYERFLSFYAVKVLRALHDAFPQVELDLVAFLKGQSFNVPLEMFRAYVEKNPDLKKKFLALGKTDEAVLNQMRSLLQDTDHRVRADTIQCLWELGRVESLDQIKTMMSDQKPEARASAAYLCGKLKLLQLKEDLIQMTLDEAWSVRKMAALALLGLSQPGKTELNRLFLQGSENQQVCAALALSLDNDQKGIERLFTMANSESELADFATELLLSFS